MSYGSGPKERSDGAAQTGNLDIRPSGFIASCHTCLCRARPSWGVMVATEGRKIWSLTCTLICGLQGRRRKKKKSVMTIQKPCDNHQIIVIKTYTEHWTTCPSQKRNRADFCFCIPLSLTMTSVKLPQWQQDHRTSPFPTKNFHLSVKSKVFKLSLALYVTFGDVINLRTKICSLKRLGQARQLSSAFCLIQASQGKILPLPVSQNLDIAVSQTIPPGDVCF